MKSTFSGFNYNAVGR